MKNSNKTMTAIALVIMLGGMTIAPAISYAQYDPCNPGSSSGGGSSGGGSSNDDDDGGSSSNQTGGGYVDTDGNGITDTHVRDLGYEYSGPSSQGNGQRPQSSMTSYNNGSQYGGNLDNGDSGSTNNSSSSSSSKVICTHFYRRGCMSKELWRASLEFTYNNISPVTIRGYLFWAVPYVRLMRRSKLAEAIMFPIAHSRAEEIAYQLGLSNKPNYMGKAVRFIMEPLSFLIGLCVSEQDYSRLYTKAEKEEIERA